MNLWCTRPKKLGEVILDSAKPKYEMNQQNQNENIELTDMTDEQLVAYAKETQDSFAFELLLERYKNYVRSKAKYYFLIGADREDIIQEGMIGLYKAIRDFNPDKLSSFHAFAELCITRQIITAIKTATRQKHMPLNSYVSLNKPMFEDDSERTLIDILSINKITNPEDIVIGQEELMLIESKIAELLSSFEASVLEAYLNGKSYQEISQSLNRHVKSIDNALQRIKRKLEKIIEEQN